jgi:hypothetical protein
LKFAAAGVGSRPGEDEDPLPLVRRPGLSGGYSDPFRIEPETGKVCEYGTECPHSKFRIGVSQTPRAPFHVAVSLGTE